MVRACRARSVRTQRYTATSTMAWMETIRTRKRVSRVTCGGLRRFEPAKGIEVGERMQVRKSRSRRIALQPRPAVRPAQYRGTPRSLSSVSRAIDGQRQAASPLLLFAHTNL